MKKLKIHYLQHVAHEGLGNIEEWIISSGHSLSSSMLFKGEQFSELSEIDWLIIMGGPMSVNDEKQFPWLADEKVFIRQAIDSGKIVLGICLGSQLVAASLGADVYRNKEKEIGWLDIELTSAARYGKLFTGMESKLKVFHWHGDTFDLPENAVHLASSEGCKNQAFSYNNNVLALQFHLEPTFELLKEMTEYGRKDLTTGKYVQSEKELLAHSPLIGLNKKLMFSLLTRLAEQVYG